MLNNAVVSVWLAFLVHFSPKIKIGTVILRILQYLASQLVMVSTRRGRDYQEDAAIAGAIAEVEAASNAATKADTAAAAIAAVAVACDAEDKAKDIEAAMHPLIWITRVWLRVWMRPRMLAPAAKSATATIEGMSMEEGWCGRG